LGATDGAVTVWSTQDGKPGTRLVGQPAPIRTIAFARDGSLIAASACDADCTQPRIGWWQASDGQLIHMESVTGTAVTGLAFTPERSILAIGVCRQSTDTALCREGAAQLWSTANPTFLDTRPGVGIALSPNVTAPLLASAEKGTVVVRQLLTNVISHTLPMSETINHLIFSPDGKWLAASGDRLTRVWRVVDGASVGDFSRSTASTSNVSFSPDGRLMAQIDGMAIKVWQVADHALRRELLTPYALYAVAFASDGTLLSYAATDRTLLHWWVGK
jgi:WD40 repeat protein